jgi:hypothetical protein
VHPSGYASGSLVSVYHAGAGMFILNTLRVREMLGKHPVAERLLRNMLNYAAQELSMPMADLPGDFERQLKTIKYHRQ